MPQLFSPYNGESDKGSSLSGVLFVHGIEFLSISIKNDSTIKGIHLNKQELKISQNADDTTAFVRNLDSVTSLLKPLNYFKEHSSLEINRTKTEAMWLGYGEKEQMNLLVSNGQENLSVLLVSFFSNNQQSANRLNFG